MMSPVISRRSLMAAPFANLAAAPSRPNIVLILADDLGYGDVHCYNSNARTRTPNIDRLAKQGVRFTDAHSPSSVCTPTRYGLLTGRYCWRTELKKGVLTGESFSMIEPGRTTLASLLKDQDYRTGVFGKWHLGLGKPPKADYSKELTPGPLDFGFDEFFGIPASLDMPPYVYVDGRLVVEQPTRRINDNGVPPRGMFWRGGPIAPGFHMEEVLPKITDRACEFIRKSSQPFFAYVPLSAPHTPWVPSTERMGKSKAGLYGDFVEEVDYSVGRVLDAVKATGAEKNTLVIVTSDNGAPWSEVDVQASFGHHANGREWRGQKADIYEAGHRVPLIVRWPGHALTNKTSDALVCLTDVFATIAEIMGHRLRSGEAEDSFSFVNALKGGAVPRKAIVNHSAQGTFAIREGNWKLVLARGSGGFTQPVTVTPGPGEPPGELYDLSFDKREELNSYEDKPEIVSRLTNLLNQWRTQGHSRPLTQ